MVRLFDMYNVHLLFQDCVPFQFSELVCKVDGKSVLNSNKLERPRFIFEVEYNNELETKFQNMVGSHGVIWAYHGSSVENFYSIINNGLLNLFNKVIARTR